MNVILPMLLGGLAPDSVHAPAVTRNDRALLVYNSG